MSKDIYGIYTTRGTLDLLGWGTLLLWVVWGVGTPWIPLLPDRLRVRGTERGSEGSHEPVEAGTPGGERCVFLAEIGPWLANCSGLVKVTICGGKDLV